MKQQEKILQTDDEAITKEREIQDCIEEGYIVEEREIVKSTVQSATKSNFKLQPSSTLRLQHWMFV